ncbi:unnamed protein product [Danaus chrysippus]|uniref:(African queen) hypothetical protein n=1 Tax=Danaus chrysippus TaxID=151541 RepID=A0A8J2R4G5_9NEOP|nr:unnamed protein product [Danaus chrysippus]
MSDYILNRLQQNNPNVTYYDLVYNEALTKIQDQVMARFGKTLSDFGMNRPQGIGEVISDLIRELDINVSSLQQQISESVPRLNTEQKLVYDIVVQRIDNGEGGLVFLDAPGGTRKTIQ